MSNCELCGEQMPDGEEMFKYHGLSGPCPKPPKKADHTDARVKVAYDTFRGGMFPEDSVPAWDEAPSWVRDVAKVAYLQGTLDAKSAAFSRS